MEQLVHTTYSPKIGSIMAHGLRVSSRTTKGTAFTQKGDFSSIRNDAQSRSEAKLEEVRRRLRPELPSRINAVFFFPGNECSILDDPESFMSGEDEHGRPAYDFGYGKDVALVVDFDRVSGPCGVGDTAKADAVFKYYLDQLSIERGGIPTFTDAKADPVKLAEAFWKGAKLYDPRTYQPYPEGAMDGCPACREQTDEFPEVWCSTPISRYAIITKYDKRNPIPERTYR